MRTFQIGRTLALLAVLVSHEAIAGEAAYVPSVEQLMADTMKTDPAPNSVDMAWWVPTDFWRAAFQNNPDVSASQAQKVIDALQPYAMFAVLRGQMGPLGAVEFQPGSEVRASLTLTTPGGTTLRPLNDDQLSGDAVLFAQIIKPMLARMLGPMGEHFEFYYFDNRGAGGTWALDAKTDGSFTLAVGPGSFVWQLPLESVFAPVECAKCGRELKGTWTFCPYDGTKVKK